MKVREVYELCYLVSRDGDWHNLIYSSKKRAQRDLRENYSPGMYTYYGRIVCSFVHPRTLF